MVFPGADWEKASPQSMQVDRPALLAALGYLEGVTGSDGISQVAVIRRGRMIWEGPHIDSRHNVWSCTKSFASLAAGLLIDDGRLSLETKFADLFPEYAEHYPTLTVAHALSQTDGYVGDEDRPWIPEAPRFQPGEMYHYGGSNALTALGRIMTKVADQPLQELFHTRIAQPIGFVQAFDWGDWGIIDDHRVNGIGGGSHKGVFTNARQMARVGHLLLNKGNWNGRQLISEDYLNKATSVHFPADMSLFDPDAWYQAIRGAYGYLFWVNGIRTDGKRLWPHAPEGTFAIQGNRNNVCFVIPEWDMVIVRMGTNKTIPMELYDRFFELLGAGLL